MLPERFEENLQALYADLFTHSDRVCADIGRMVEALARVMTCGQSGHIKQP